MHTIIVPINGSGSERAVPVARKLAEGFDARMVLVHVQERILRGRGPRIPAQVDEEARLAHARGVVDSLQSAGFDAQLEVHRTVFDHPASVVAAAARRHDADAIVLATRPHAPSAGASSIAQRLLQTAPCPVLVVTPHSTREAFRRSGRSEATAV